MKSKGIRISDDIDDVISVILQDILEEIPNGDEFYWSILFLDVVGNIGEQETPQFQDEIFKLEKGLFLTWEELNSLAKKFEQLIWIIILGCKDIELIKRYDNEQECYETCDIVIEFFDSSYWEVFSKDIQLIDRLAVKFKQIKYLEPDFIEKQYENHDQA